MYIFIYNKIMEHFGSTNYKQGRHLEVCELQRDITYDTD